VLIDFILCSLPLYICLCLSLGREVALFQYIPDLFLCANYWWKQNVLFREWVTEHNFQRFTGKFLHAICKEPEGLQ